MSEITNPTIVSRSTDKAVLTWNWPAGIKCVRIIMMHRLGGVDPVQLSLDDLNKVSALCFINEFKQAGNQCVCPVRPTDTGRLSFMIYACSDDGQSLVQGYKSPVVAESAKNCEVHCHIKYRKTSKTKHHKIATIRVITDTDIPAGVLQYVVSGSTYPLNFETPRGSHDIEPIVIRAEEFLGVEICPGHENEFTLSCHY